MPRDAVEAIIKGTSAEFRIGIWRRVARGVAHDLLNAAMPLRSLSIAPRSGEADLEGRLQLARDTAERVAGLGLALHRLEASIRESEDEEAGGRWPLFREMVRWAVPRSVRIEHSEGSDLGSACSPRSTEIVFWTVAFCGELVDGNSGEIGLEAEGGKVVAHLPPMKDAGDPVTAEARSALDALVQTGIVELADAGGGRSQVTILVE